MFKRLIGTHVVIRAPGTGAWMGILDAVDGSTVRLLDARRTPRWDGAAACSGMASSGPHGLRVTPPVDIAVIYDVLEVLSVTDDAQTVWTTAPKWSPAPHDYN